MSRIHPKRHDGREIDLPTIADGAIEDISRRSASAIGFNLPNGSTQYIIGSVLHYLKDDIWHEYDLRWNPSTDPNWQYEMNGADYRALARDHTDKTSMIRFEKESHWLELGSELISWDRPNGSENFGIPRKVPSLIEADKDNLPTRCGNIRWNNIFGPGRHLRLIPLERRFSKEIILQTRQLPSPQGQIDEPSLVIRWMFDTDIDIRINGEIWDGVSTVETQGKIEFIDTDTTHWYWIHPHAIDSDGDKEFGDYRLSSVNGIKYVELIFDYQWIENAAYPVVIDPDTFQSQTGDGEIQGSNSEYPVSRSTSTASDDAATTFNCGQVATRVGFTNERGYLIFDTSAIIDTDIVSDVTLTMVATSDSSTTDFIVQIAELVWATPLATSRETKYDGALTATIGGDWRSTLSMSLSTQYTSDSLTNSYVKLTTNTSYAIVSQEDRNNSSPPNSEVIALASFDHATSSFRPFLTITAGSLSSSSSSSSRSSSSSQSSSSSSQSSSSRSSSSSSSSRSSSSSSSSQSSSSSSSSRSSSSSLRQVLTLVDFAGFETGGLEELVSTTGTPRVVLGTVL